MIRPLRIFLSAGEESGDRIAADLAAAILRLEPEAELRGVGGRRMAAAGVSILRDPTEISVMWFVDVFRNLRTFVRMFDETVREVSRWRPDAVVPVDYPGFNVRLAERARGMEVPVVYYVAPQVWAWYRSRIHRVADAVDRMLVIFPFEEALFREAGVPVAYVGHPVSERFQGFAPDPAVRGRAGAAPGEALVALLPGSRRSVVRRNLPLMLEAAARLSAAEKGLKFACAFSKPRIAALASELARGSPVPLAVLDGSVHDLMASSRLALVSAGSATVELAALGTPMVVVYKVSLLSRLLSLLMNRSPHIAMVNLLAGRRAVPEFLLWRRLPGLVADAALPLLRDGPEREAQLAALAEVRAALGGPGASQRAAEEVLRHACAERARRGEGK
ncbi:MAG: lipid-A-disaccharide synthase [Planctomycetes bacterium]|nr:lipid-A-disaccharide synthase [Planctomycetota bacterium]